MTPRTRSVLIRIAVIAVWVVLCVASYAWLRSHGIPLRRLPRAIHTLLRGYGWWGPAVLLGLYVLRSMLVFIPTTVLTFVGGSLYGPIFGTLLNILGDNLSATVGFCLGRVFGRRFVQEHERGWIRAYDELLQAEGFLSILCMRVLFFPFDLVNYGSGLSGIGFRQYAFGTLLGTLPAVITLTVLGDVFVNPKALMGFLVLLALMILGVFLLRRSAWVRERLLSKKSSHHHG